MRNLLKNKDAHIMVNDSHSLMSQLKDKKKLFTARVIKISYHTRWFQHITGQPINWILYSVDNNILQNLTILREYVGMDADIHGPSIPHLKAKTVQRKIQHVDHIQIPSVPKTILDKYKEVTICCDLMHINGIFFLDNISRNIMFATGSMIKNWNIENIPYGITHVHKLYLQRGFNITLIHANS